MSAPLVLPGSISGLLRRGSPLLSPLDGERAVVVHVEDVGCHIAVESGRVYRYTHRSLHLDLSDATGRAHAVLWLAGHLGFNGEGASVWWMGEGTSTAPDAKMVLRVTRSDWLPRGLALTFWDGAGRRPVGVRSELVVAVPALADINPNDPRTLEDGSRWVDAEALRLVCLHVAGLS